MRTLLLAFLPLTVLGANKRAASVGSTFELYAYSSSFGGLPLYYADGLAYVGDPRLSNSSDAAAVIFSTSPTHHFIGNPITPQSRTWSNATLFVPASDSSDKRVGFLPPTNGTGNDTITVSGFAFYGSTAVLIGDGRAIATAFYGKQLKAGGYGLFWNDTSEGNVPLTLRSVAPSSADNGTDQ